GDRAERAAGAMPGSADRVGPGDGARGRGVAGRPQRAGGGRAVAGPHRRRPPQAPPAPPHKFSVGPHQVTAVPSSPPAPPPPPAAGPATAADAAHAATCIPEEVPRGEPQPPAAAAMSAADAAAAHGADTAALMWRDVKRLREAAHAEGWTDETPVPPEFFGPL